MKYTKTSFIGQARLFFGRTMMRPLHIGNVSSSSVYLHFQLINSCHSFVKKRARIYHVRNKAGFAQSALGTMLFGWKTIGPPQWIDGCRCRLQGCFLHRFDLKITSEESEYGTRCNGDEVYAGVAQYQALERHFAHHHRQNMPRHRCSGDKMFPGVA